MTSCLAVRTIMCCTSRHERSRLDVNKPCYTKGNVDSVYPLLLTLWEISLVKQPPIVTLYHLFRRVKKNRYEHCLRREMTFRYWPGISFIARKCERRALGKLWPPQEQRKISATIYLRLSNLISKNSCQLA